MPRQVPTTLRRRFSRSTPAEEASSITFLIGRRGSRPQHPLPNRPPALQAFRSDLSRTPSVSTHGCHGSLSYPRVPAEFNPGERDYYTMFRSTIGELILPSARVQRAIYARSHVFKGKIEMYIYQPTCASPDQNFRHGKHYYVSVNGEMRFL